MSSIEHNDASGVKTEPAKIRLTRMGWAAFWIFLLCVTNIVVFGIGMKVGATDLGEDMNAVLVGAQKLSDDIRSGDYSPDQQYYGSLCEQPLETYGDGYVQYYVGPAADRAVRIDYTDDGYLKFQILQ